MTHEDIIRMAREVCDTADPILDDESDLAVFRLDELERFAALVAAAEREACAQVCEDNKGGMSSYFKGEYAAAIRARGEK